MGIAKSIYGYAIYDAYTSDTERFFRILSDKLDADFIIEAYDEDFKPLFGGKKQLTSFLKMNKYKITITYDEYKIDSRNVLLPFYELNVPIRYSETDSLDFTFGPNKVVRITFLTFEHLWRWFIESLKFDSPYNDREQSVIKYNILRTEYWNILKKIDISSLFISTDGQYQIEDLQDIEQFPCVEFSDIPKIAKELDDITSFDFEIILQAKVVTDLDKGFLSKPDLKIAFIDRLKN